MRLLKQLEWVVSSAFGQERYCGAGQTSLHGGGGLPTWRVASPYTEVLSSLHGGFRFPTWGWRTPYVEGRVTLRGGFEFPTWRVWVSYVE